MELGSCVDEPEASYIVDARPEGCYMDQEHFWCDHTCREEHCAHEPGTTLTEDTVTGCPRCRNFSGRTLLEAIDCAMSLGGGTECVFSQPLEAMRRALTAPSFFSRENAQLQVIFVTAQDDCSAADPRLFDPAEDDPEGYLGPLTPFRYFEHGVECHVNGREEGPRFDCWPAEDEGALLRPIREYADFLRLMTRPFQTSVLVVAGPDRTGTILVEKDEQGRPALAPSCSLNSDAYALPAMRLGALVDDLTGPEPVEHRPFVSLCGRDLLSYQWDFIPHLCSDFEGAERLLRSPVRGCSPRADLSLVDGFTSPGWCADRCIAMRVFSFDDDVSPVVIPNCIEVCPEGYCPRNRDPRRAYAGGLPGPGYYTTLDLDLPVPECYYLLAREATSPYDPSDPSDPENVLPFVELVTRQVTPFYSHVEVCCESEAPDSRESRCRDYRDDDGDGLVDDMDEDCQGY